MHKVLWCVSNRAGVIAAVPIAPIAAAILSGKIVQQADLFVPVIAGGAWATYSLTLGAMAEILATVRRIETRGRLGDEG